MQDLVEKSELIMVGSSPVKTATSVSALGPLDKVVIATFFAARIFEASMVCPAEHSEESSQWIVAGDCAENSELWKGREVVCGS